MNNTGSLVLCNNLVLEIEISSNTETVLYKFSDKSEWTEANIDYLEDTENVTGYADDSPVQPGFKINDQVYFLGEFIKN